MTIGEVNQISTNNVFRTTVHFNNVPYEILIIEKRSKMKNWKREIEILPYEVKFEKDPDFEKFKKYIDDNFDSIVKKFPLE